MIQWSGVKFYLPSLAGVYCLCAVLKVRSSDAARIIFNLPSIFIGPNYYTLLAIITFYHRFKTGQRFVHFGLLPTISPLRLPHFLTFSYGFRLRSSLAKKLLQFYKRLSDLKEDECSYRLI